MDLDSVILNCLRETSQSELLASFDEFSGPEWSAWVEVINYMGLAQIIYSRLRKQGLSLPAQVAAQLQANLHLNSANNLGILRGLHKISEVFESGGISFILLKGVFLAEKLYGNFGERQITDLDILIHIDDMSRAIKLVEELGYRSKTSYDPQFELQVTQHVPPYYMDGMPMLEIHQALLDPMPHFHIDMDGIWQRALRTRVGGRKMLVLCDEDLLLHLCAHAAYNHLFDNELRLLYDIKLLVQKYGAGLAWPALGRRAQAWGIQNAVYLALRLTDELLGCPLPSDGWQTLQPAEFDERLLQACRVRIFGKQSVEGGLVVIWSQAGPVNRMLAALRRVFIPRPLLARKYHLSPDSKRLFLYYPVRFFDLLTKYTGRLFELQKTNGQEAQTMALDTDLFKFLEYKQNR